MQLDPIRFLALLTICLGLLIVVASFVVWLLSNRFNAGIMTAGVALAGAGGAKEVGESFLARLPSYYEGPEDKEESPPRRKRKRR